MFSLLGELASGPRIELIVFWHGQLLLRARLRRDDLSMG